MHLVQLDVHRGPGLPASGVSTGVLAPGLVLLFGPNASGKSTLGRVMRGMLWSDLAPAGIQATAQWRPRTGGPVVEAALMLGRVHWHDQAPGPYDEALASATHLRLQDLLDHQNASDRAIANQIQRELDGGYDLAGLSPLVRPSSRPGRTLKRSLTDATRTLRDRVDQTDALAADEARLAGLSARAQRAALQMPRSV